MIVKMDWLDKLTSDIDEIKTAVIQMKIDHNQDRNEFRLAIEELKLKVARLTSKPKDKDNARISR